MREATAVFNAAGSSQVGSEVARQKQIQDSTLAAKIATLNAAVKTSEAANAEVEKLFTARDTTSPASIPAPAASMPASECLRDRVQRRAVTRAGLGFRAQPS